MSTIKNILPLAAVLLVLISFACNRDNVLDDDLHAAINSSGQTAEELLLPLPSQYDRIPQDPRNPITEEKIKLGMPLFHEPGLLINPESSANLGTASCASCHVLENGGRAGIPQGIGEIGRGFGIQGEARTLNTGGELLADVQPIASPTVINSAYSPAALWGGILGAFGVNVGTESRWNTFPADLNRLGYHPIETQALAGIKVHRLGVNADLVERLGYKDLFDQAFPNTPENERYTPLTAALAIAAYERSLIASDAPFQRWLRGNSSALNSTEKLGGSIFFGKAGCANCHRGPALNDDKFHAVGALNLDQYPGSFTIIRPDPAGSQNLGRGGFTNQPEDFHKFKTPTVYNSGNFLMHGAQFSNNREVVEYFNEAVPSNPLVPQSQISPFFKPLNLSDQEVDALVAFLDNGLFDPSIATRGTPDTLPSGNCFPNADPLSRLQLGCD